MGSEKKPDAAKAEGKPEPKANAKPDATPEAKADATLEAKADATPEAKADAKPVEQSADYDKPRSKTEPAEPPRKPTPEELPAIEPPEPLDEPWPDATPQPMKPVDPPIARARTATIGAPMGAEFGKPPEMPKLGAAAPTGQGSVEDPTYMPAPKDVPSGNADDPAPPPGVVPKGDSRSMRRGNEFALIYRIGTFVITRFGTVGKRGQWRVVEYPTSSSASHSYAKECSRFVSEGFSDYRE